MNRALQQDVSRAQGYPWALVDAPPVCDLVAELTSTLAHNDVVEMAPVKPVQRVRLQVYSSDHSDEMQT